MYVFCYAADKIQFLCARWCVLQERATSSNWQTAFNAINVLCGVGLLTTPYAMAISGTGALLLLLVVGESCLSGSAELSQQRRRSRWVSA
jgi:hypothetical protein